MLYWHTASQRHAAPCGFWLTTSRRDLANRAMLSVSEAQKGRVAAQAALAGINNSKKREAFPETSS